MCVSVCVHVSVCACLCVLVCVRECAEATSPLCQRDLQLVILRLEVSVGWARVRGLFVVCAIDAGCLSGRRGFTPRFLAKVNYLHMLLLVLTLAAS